MKRFFAFLLLEEGERIVHFKGLWRPAIGRHGLEWPAMLIDTKTGQRRTVTPVWDRMRLADIWCRLTVTERRP